MPDAEAFQAAMKGIGIIGGIFGFVIALLISALIYWLIVKSEEEQPICSHVSLSVLHIYCGYRTIHRRTSDLLFKYRSHDRRHVFKRHHPGRRAAQIGIGCI
ncbi:hypothetical protein PO124_06465 [Bacillus licheniformis]|nr:hypothetical protein [Bacillus licheniformis]